MLLNYRCYVVLPLYLAYNIRVSGELLSVAVGVGSTVAASLLSGIAYYGHCRFYECCTEKWISASGYELRDKMRRKLYGQHLAQKVIEVALTAHFQNKKPKKALVMSFHGWTGCGKSYLSSIIAESFYKKGMNSDFVHMFISTMHFSDSNKVNHYQDQLRAWISGNVSKCERSLFIFDEVDKMPAKVMDSIKPFIDHYEYLDDNDFRKSTFIFLSNSGGNEITRKTQENYELGKRREDIGLKEMENVIISNAFNTEGGLKMSELISAHLIDHFVPFLPLERQHIVLCIRDYMNSRNFEPTEKRIVSIADSLQYFPKSDPLYSSSGCKRIAQKTELLISAEREILRSELQSLVTDTYDDENEI